MLLKESRELVLDSQIMVQTISYTEEEEQQQQEQQHLLSLTSGAAGRNGRGQGGRIFLYQ
jgi:hypothetical protein